MVSNYYLLLLNVENIEFEVEYLTSVEYEIKKALKNFPGFKMIGPYSLDTYCKIFYKSESINNDYTASMEMLVKPNDKEHLAEKLALKMSLLQNDEKILIIDPYFFDGGKNTVDLVLSVFQKSAISPKELQIISRKNEGKSANEISENIKLFEDKLKIILPQIKLNLHKDDRFHDRFWIGLDTSCGVLMGTSLNGLAKRLCIVEQICTDDVLEIIDECKTILGSIS